MLIIILFTARESHGGTRLVRRADFNAGSHINTIFRIRCKLTDPSIEKKITGPLEKRHVTYFGKKKSLLISLTFPRIFLKNLISISYRK